VVVVLAAVVVGAVDVAAVVFTVVDIAGLEDVAGVVALVPHPIRKSVTDSRTIKDNNPFFILPPNLFRKNLPTCQIIFYSVNIPLHFHLL
jgi:hypothetical protein